MSFIQSASIAFSEVESRKNLREGLLTFGISFLDDAMLGILKNDLILIGASSGAGKTQTCVNIALANVERGKRVHFIALEAEMYEIERRIKYQLFAKHFFEAKANFSKLKKMLQNLTEAEKEKLKKSEDMFKIKINFQEWMVGDYIKSLEIFEAEAAKEFINKYTTLFSFYKTDKFDVDDLSMRVLECAQSTDLIIVDHVHYFDFDDDNENNSMKKIAKASRSLALENGIPIILVSHLRKRDKNANDLVPGLEEFHGSSDLYKISTKAITLSPGAWSPNGKLQTFFRIVKNRFEGSVTRVCASVNYIAREGKYEEKYKIGDANQKRDNGFSELAFDDYPEWAVHADRETCGPANVPKRPTAPVTAKERARHFQGV